MNRETIIADLARTYFGLATLDSPAEPTDFLGHFTTATRIALTLAYDNGYEAAVADQESLAINPPAVPPTESGEPDRDPPMAEPPPESLPTVVEHHRNGVSGAPFNVVLFTDHGPHGSRKLGIVFEAAHHVAVFDLAKLAAGDIAFGSNSWRGDQFEPRLRRLIAEHHAAEG